MIELVLQLMQFPVSCMIEHVEEPERQMDELVRKVEHTMVELSAG